MAIGRRAPGRAVLVGFFCALLPMPSAVAAGCSGPVRVETLHVHVTSTREVVRVGKPAALEVTVERAVAHNELVPVENANVLVVAEVGRTSIGTSGTTGAAGLAPISLAVPKRSSIGPADVTVIVTQQPVHCVEEYGETLEKGLFTVRR